MKAVQKTHQAEVVALINSVDDQDVQNEMQAISYNYAQALAGLRLAKNYLAKIDDETGTDHTEIKVEIINLIESIKNSEISLLEMCSNY